jgi:hypothetical protein
MCMFKPNCAAFVIYAANNWFSVKIRFNPLSYLTVNIGSISSVDSLYCELVWPRSTIPSQKTDNIVLIGNGERRISYPISEVHSLIVLEFDKGSFS